MTSFLSRIIRAVRPKPKVVRGRWSGRVIRYADAGRTADDFATLGEFFAWLGGKPYEASAEPTSPVEGGASVPPSSAVTPRTEQED